MWIDAVEFSTTVDGNAAKTNDIRENLKLLMDNMSDANFHGQNVQRKPTREFIYKALETAIVWNTENMGMPFNTHTKHPTCFKTPICDEETSEDAEGFQWVNEQTKARLRALARAGGTMGYLDVQYGIEHVKREADWGEFWRGKM